MNGQWAGQRPFTSISDIGVAGSAANLPDLIYSFLALLLDLHDFYHM